MTERETVRRTSRMTDRDHGRKRAQRSRLAATLGTVLAAAALAGTPAAAAGTPSGRLGLGVDAGVLKWQEGAWDYGAPDQFGRLRLSYGLGRHWTLHAAWSQGHTRPGVEIPGEESGWSFTTHAPYSTLIRQPMLEFEHRLSPDARFCPSLTAGVGVTSWRVIRPDDIEDTWSPSGPTVTGYDVDGNHAELKGDDLTFGVGLGLDVTVTRALHLGLGARYQILHDNPRDNVGMSALWGPAHVDANSALTSAWAGLTWWFGASDADRDGVPDGRDRCPDQAEDRDNFNDGDGCPDLDNDEDGLPDDADQCPQLAEDADGYQDEDGCPDLDNDGDGIPDARDRCPDQAEDLNGVQDQDGCPDRDTDGDGVPDGRDRCPDTARAVSVDADGCPVAPPASPAPKAKPSAAAPAVPPVAAAQKPADFVLEGVAFASGSAELTASARLQLEEVAAWLAGEPGRAEIRGHTDSSGDASANRALSLRRAEAVKAALVAMGLPARDFVTVGAGADQPLADNATPAGRAKNRRVEIRRLP